jgi:hypothetical protein
MSEQQRQDAGWQNAMDYQDEVDTEWGVIIVPPVPYVTRCLNCYGHEIRIGDTVWHCNGALCTVEYITVLRNGDHNIHYSTARFDCLNAESEYFTPAQRGYFGYTIAV